MWGRALDLFSETVTRSRAEQERAVAEALRTEPEVGSLLRDLLRTETEPDPAAADFEAMAAELFPAEDDAEAVDPYLGRVIGPYRVESVLGVGGMGRVYLAVHGDYKGCVALKVLPDSVSADRMARFAMEKEHLAKFQHPSIAQLYYADTTEDGTAYFAMEYVEGEPITSFCTRLRLPLRERLRLFLQVCDAVQAAHAQRIVHRDLKPSNIFVRKDGGVKLLDFGIAEGSDRAHDPGTAAMMSLPYAAPEHGEAGAGIGVDVFSLGVLLHEMLTGRLPFTTQGRTAEDIRRVVRAGRWAAPSSAASEKRDLGKVSRTGWRELDHLVRRSTERSVGERYASVEAMARELRQHLATEPLETIDAGWTYRAERFTRRHAGGLVVAAAVLLTLVGVTGTYTYRLSRARDAALAEAAHSARIEQFLENMLNGGAGGAGPREDMRVRDLLEVGVGNAGALDNDPRLQAELFEMLGGVYADMDAFEKADGLFRRALEERSGLFGRDSPEVAKTLVETSKLREGERRLTEAQQIAEEAVGIDTRRLPPNDPRRLHAEIQLGSVLVSQGENPKAIRILESVLARERQQSDTLSDLSDAFDDLGIAEQNLGHYDAAEIANQQGMVIDRKLVGDRHPDIASYLLNQAQIDLRRRRYADSEAHAREALGIERAWLGPDHREVASALTSLADALSYEGRDAEALPLLEDALRIEQQVYKVPSGALAHTLAALGHVSAAMGHTAGAESYDEQSIKVYRTIYPQGNASTGVLLFNLARLEIRDGNFVQAERHLRESLELESRDLPADDPRVADVKLLLADTQAKLANAGRRGPASRAVATAQRSAR